MAGDDLMKAANANAEKDLSVMLGLIRGKAPLLRCPHGNEASLKCILGAYVVFTLTDEEFVAPCVCAVAADTPDRARRAWVALCSAD